METAMIFVNKRFQSQVNIGDPWDCWEWRRYAGTQKYARSTWEGKIGKAHRVAFMWWHGRAILSGLEIMHLCDNPPCVNPCHLKEGTHRENMLDSHAKDRSGTVIPTLASMAKHLANIPRGDQHWTRAQPEKVPAGEKNPNSHITWDIARDIRARRAAGQMLKEIAPLYHISLVTVSMICRNQAWVEPGQERQVKRKGKPGPPAKPLPLFICQLPTCGKQFTRRTRTAIPAKYCCRKCASTANFGNLGKFAHVSP